MTDFSDASLSPLVSPLRSLPSRDHRRTDSGLDFRPHPSSSGMHTSQAFPRRQSHLTASAGNRARYLDWGQVEYLPSSSTDRDFSPRSPIGDVSRHASSVIIPQTPSPKSKVRSYLAATSACNEVSPAFRASVLQAHQAGHASNGCTPRLTRLRFTQVAPASFNDPPSLSSSPSSTALSLTTPPTPQSQYSSVRHHKRSSALFFVAPSVASLRSETPCELQRERYTPSTAPLSHGPRESRPISHRSSFAASRAPHTFSIKCGLLPPRARPTLAMSMQIHAPTPVMSTHPMSPPLPSRTRQRSTSRPGSSSRPSSPLPSSVPLPQRPPMPRPPSRSERLLRDTLRRAEEQERTLNPTPSLFGLSHPAPNVPSSVAQMFGPCRLPDGSPVGQRHRRHTSSSIQSDSSCDREILDEESCEDEEDQEWLWRTSGRSCSLNPSRQGHGTAYSRVGPVGNLDSLQYGTPASPSPARVHLQRAAMSSPSVPRRHSHSQSVSHVPTLARASTDEHSMTPHEAVLRSRLEGVLKSAKAQDRRTRSVERRDLDSGFSSGSGNSIASSRNLSGEGDFFFGVSGDPRSTSNKVAGVASSPRREHRHLHLASPTPPRPPHKYPKSNGSSGSASPLTPPPSPPFNAHVAAAQCRAMDGYISFANVEGLGVPDGSDEETDEDAKSRSRWFQWLHISGKAAVPNSRARSRSDSSSSASR